MANFTGVKIFQCLKKLEDSPEDPIVADLSNKITIGNVNNERTLQTRLLAILEREFTYENLNATYLQFNVEVETPSDENPTISDLKVWVLKTKYKAGKFVAEKELLSWIEIKFYHGDSVTDSKIEDIKSDISKAKNEVGDGDGSPISIVCTHEAPEWEQAIDSLKGEDDNDQFLIHFKVP